MTRKREELIHTIHLNKQSLSVHDATQFYKQYTTLLTLELSTGVVHDDLHTTQTCTDRQLYYAIVNFAHIKKS